MIDVASSGNERVSRLDKINVRASFLTLDTLVFRDESLGLYDAKESELASIARGILAAESILPNLDPRKLHAAFLLAI